MPKLAMTQLSLLSAAAREPCGRVMMVIQSGTIEGKAFDLASDLLGQCRRKAIIVSIYAKRIGHSDDRIGA